MKTVVEGGDYGASADDVTAAEMMLAATEMNVELGGGAVAGGGCAVAEVRR